MHVRQLAFLDSMTTKERRNPTSIDEPRLARIAAGSGLTKREADAVFELFAAVEERYRMRGYR